MRMFLFFFLPTVDEEDQRIYQKFHKQLIKLGFYMLQYSVYIKVIQNDLSYKQYINKIDSILPQKGNIAIIKLTEKQYENMVYLRGEQNKFDILVGGRELIVFGGGNDS